MDKRPHRTRTTEGLEHALAAARGAQQAAHAPYSRFKVGAALLDADNNLTTGCNVESASFGLTLCAERNAISTRIAQLGKAERQPPIELVAIRTDAATPTAPCGACRQWLAEFCPPATLVVSEASDGSQCVWAVGELLPDAFRSSELESFCGVAS